MKSGHAWALGALIAFGMMSGGQTPAAPLGPQSQPALATADEAAQGDVHLIQKRSKSLSKGKSFKGKSFKGKPFSKGKSFKPGRKISPKWRFHGHKTYRGRRFKDGIYWYFWAPWVGSYLYFQSYQACYDECRYYGYGHAYCDDLCR